MLLISQGLKKDTKLTNTAIRNKKYDEEERIMSNIYTKLWR